MVHSNRFSIKVINELSKQIKKYIGGLKTKKTEPIGPVLKFRANLYYFSPINGRLSNIAKRMVLWI